MSANKRDQVEPHLWAEQNSGMAGVIPAWRLTAMLFEDERIVDEREAAEERWLKNHSADQSSS